MKGLGMSFDIMWQISSFTKSEQEPLLSAVVHLPQRHRMSNAKKSIPEHPLDTRVDCAPRG